MNTLTLSASAPPLAIVDGIPTTDLSHIRQALDLANAVAAQVQATVFSAVLSGDANWEPARCLFGFTDEKTPFAMMVDRDAMIVSADDLPCRIIELGGMFFTTEQLTNIAAACTQKLHELVEGRSAQ